MRRKVFITNRGFHSYDEAARYGTLVPVTIGNVDLRHTDRLEAKIQSVLREASANDILLLSGASIIQLYCVGYMFRKHGKVNVLYYDAREYVFREAQTFAERDLSQFMAGAITCPDCGEVMTDAEFNAVASEPCDECRAAKIK